MNIFPFPLGEKSSDDSLDPLVGQKFVDTDGRTYRLVKAKTALTAPAKKALLYTVTGGDRSFKKCTLAATLYAYNVAGIGDNALSGNVAANEYFYAHCGEGDIVEAIPAVTTIAAGDALAATTTTAGSLGLVAVAATTTGVNAMARSFARSLGAAGTGLANVNVELRGLS